MSGAIAASATMRGAPASADRAPIGRQRHF
jgi:hypothetical protein